MAVQVRKIADESYEVALKHIRDNREAIDSIVDELVERETITGEVSTLPVCVDRTAPVSPAKDNGRRPTTLTCCSVVIHIAICNNCM